MNHFNTEGNPEIDLWVEKYRPRDLEDYIGNEHMTEKVKSYLKDGDIPHLMFSGKQGTGKTTLAKIIVNKIECDYLYINASDQNSVNDIREDVKQFVATVSMNDNIKIVILDEFDHMSRSAQAALRNIMETYVETSRFILTCNYLERVIQPIISRTQSFVVRPPKKRILGSHLVRILNQENVKYKNKDVATLVKKYYPDIRKLINAADQMTKKTAEGRVLKVDRQSLIGSDFNLQLLELLKNGASINDIRQHVANDERKEFEDTYRFLYDEVDSFANGVSDAILVLADAQYKDTMVVDKEINFVSCMIKLINI